MSKINRNAIVECALTDIHVNILFRINNRSKFYKNAIIMNYYIMEISSFIYFNNK